MRRRLREKQEKRKQGKRICAMFLLVLTVISGGGNVLPVRAESTEVELVEHQNAEKLAFDREDGAMSKTNMEGMAAEADDRQIGYDLEMEDTESEVTYADEEMQTAENEKSRADIDSQAATVEEGTGAELQDGISMPEQSMSVTSYGGGWFYDYWMCSSWMDFVVGAWLNGAKKFVLLEDIPITERWMITDGACFTINGNGHQMVNYLSQPGPMITVQNGATLITEGNLTLNGNNHRNNGAAAEGGSSAVDCINASWYGSDTTICNNWNYGYIGVDHLGGGTGFNIVSENGSGFPAVGVFNNCRAYNCDGAAFFARNTDGRGATLICNNCVAYDSSWGFMVTDGGMYLTDCSAQAPRYDGSKWLYGGAGIAYMGQASGSAKGCSMQGANCGLWLNAANRIEIRQCQIKNSQSGILATANEPWSTYLLDACEIYGNTHGLIHGFFNRPTGEIEKSSLHNNTTATCNSGNLSVTACAIYDNGTGIDNVDGAYCAQKDGRMERNNSYDVLQKGEYHLSGETAICGKGIWLAKDRSLRLSGALSQNLSKISLTLEEECPEPGRLVLSCDYDKTQNTADRMKEKFTLTNTHTKTWNAGQGKYRSAILRAGTGSNASVGQVIVSETYTIAFEGNLDNPHVTFSLPEQKPLYWKEAQTISAPALAVFYDGRVFTSLEQTGWRQTAKTTEEFWQIGQDKVFSAEACTKDYCFYANYDVIADVLICGNGQTAGEDYRIRDCKKTVSLPENTFARIEESLVWDENFAEKVLERKTYAHMGWAMREDAIYKDADVLAVGSPADLNAWGMQALESGTEKVDVDGRLEPLTFYSVWDRPPEISAKNRYWSKNQVKAGAVTKQEVLRTAGASDAEDRENLVLDVELPDEKTLLSLGEKGYVTARYKAVDGAGNMTERLVKMGITESGIYQGQYRDGNAIVLRKIDQTYYNKKTEEAGGLMEESLWYVDPACKEKILQTFTAQEEEEPVFSYELSLSE